MYSSKSVGVSGKIKTTRLQCVPDLHWRNSIESHLDNSAYCVSQASRTKNFTHIHELIHGLVGRIEHVGQSSYTRLNALNSRIDFIALGNKSAQFLLGIFKSFFVGVFCHA